MYFNNDNVTLFNDDCFNVMGDMVKNNIKINVILTSPPYNTGRTCKTQRSIDNYENRYDIHLDDMSNDEYLDWTINLFNSYEKILEKDGVILYNMSYGNENPDIMWLTLAKIIQKTPFMIADDIIWKKKSALPNNVSHNKLTRIVEHVFVFCRKQEYKTFQGNKQLKSVSPKGQKYYENEFNFIEAKNNDGSCSLNKATFSTELCEKLLSLYAKENSIVFDSFIGTGTTAVACNNLNLKVIGSELSEGQCEFAVKRIKRIL